MKMQSPVSHSDAVQALTQLLGFRIVKEEGLQTEMRKGRIHVIVRTFVEPPRTEIRFHEDRGGVSQKLVLERSSRLLRFKQQLEVALEKQKRFTEALVKETEKAFEKAFFESISSHGCPFYVDCPHFKELYFLTYCITEYHYCDEYRRRAGLRRRGLTGKIDKTG